MKKSEIILSAALLLVPALATRAQNADPTAATPAVAPTHYRELGVFAPVVRPQLPPKLAAAAPAQSSSTPAPAPAAQTSAAAIAATQPAARTAIPAVAAESAKAAPQVVPTQAPIETAKAAPQAETAPTPKVEVAATSEPVQPTPIQPIPAAAQVAIAFAPDVQPVSTAAPATEIAGITPHNLTLTEISIPTPKVEVAIAPKAEAPKPAAPAVEVAVAPIHLTPKPIPTVNITMAHVELPESTLLHVQLAQSISATTTLRTARFEAHLSEPIVVDGKIIITTGAVIRGHIIGLRSNVHTGRNAAIQLQPDTLTITDGTSYKLDAQVYDLNLADHDTPLSAENILPAVTASSDIDAGAGTPIGTTSGGPVGAFVGAGIGGTTTMIWFRHDANTTLYQGTEIIFSLNHAVQLAK